MVKRNAHTAVLTIPGTGGKTVRGLWEKGSAPTTIIIRGHYDPVNNSRVVIKKNSVGDEKEVHGEFYTHAKLPDVKPIHMTISEIGIDVDIINSDSYQSHSVIYV